MSEKEVVLCPNCGEPMVPSRMDGSFKFDGSVDFSGLKCPKCSSLLKDETATNV